MSSQKEGHQPFVAVRTHLFDVSGIDMNGANRAYMGPKHGYAGAIVRVVIVQHTEIAALVASLQRVSLMFDMKQRKIKHLDGY